VNESPSEGAPARYASLDVWRGVAAMSVVLYHFSGVALDRDSAAVRVLLTGWAGVFLFFPISGYCILGALHSRENGSLRTFLTRRWRRIMVPYWASIALAIAVGLAALPFNSGTLDDLTLTPGIWASVLTLTQVFTGEVGRINPVYWSLCYEEQFYLVMGLLLFIDSRSRVPAIVAITAAAAIYAMPLWPWRVQGLFLEYWLCFAVGCAAYTWLHAPVRRLAALAILLLATAVSVATINGALAISIAMAVALVTLAPHDRAIVRFPLGAAFAWLGSFSYSLYLVHSPVGGRVVNLLGRLSWPGWTIVPVAVVVSIATAWVFYRLVESRSTPSRANAAPSPARIGPLTSARAEAVA
jgi:peptidoglycan/LPS O-acetylase OafA/YrhL